MYITGGGRFKWGEGWKERGKDGIVEAWEQNIGMVG